MSDDTDPLFREQTTAPPSEVPGSGPAVAARPLGSPGGTDPDWPTNPLPTDPGVTDPTARRPRAMDVAPVQRAQVVVPAPGKPANTTDETALASSLLAGLASSAPPPPPIRESDGRPVAVAAVPAHRPPKAHRTDPEEPAVVVNITQEMPRRDPNADRVTDISARRLAELAQVSAAAGSASRLEDTTAPGRRQTEKRRVVLGVGLGIAVAVCLVAALIIGRDILAGRGDAGLASGAMSATAPSGEPTSVTSASAFAVPVTPAVSATSSAPLASSSIMIAPASPPSSPPSVVPSPHPPVKPATSDGKREPGKREPAKPEALKNDIPRSL